MVVNVGNAPSVFDGRYNLVRPLARVTSDGYVHAADRVHTHRTCAIKILDPDIGDKTRKRRRRCFPAARAVQFADVEQTPCSPGLAGITARRYG